MQFNGGFVNLKRKHFNSFIKMYFGYNHLIFTPNIAHWSSRNIYQIHVNIGYFIYLSSLEEIYSFDD